MASIAAPQKHRWFFLVFFFNTKLRGVSSCHRFSRCVLFEPNQGGEGSIPMVFSPKRVDTVDGSENQPTLGW